ncbi:MAG: hypothetical protein LUG56_02925 [Lachnospiraceae bacterium]|nr:hypothetical protein [Lachnospiraceae bacterium]
MKRIAFSLAAAVMLVPTAASAQDDVTEELNQILETQFSAEAESVLGDYLGLDALQEAFAANGMQIQAQLGLTEEAGALLEGTLPEDTYLSFGFQQDPNAKQWLLSFGAGLEEESLLDMSLYGDEEILALSLPQFYSGALGLRAGSFLEQYNASALKEYLGLGDLGIDDFEMSFYPEDTWAEAEEGSLEAELSDTVQQAVDEFMESGFSISKAEEGDGVTYTAVIETDAVLDLYEVIWDEYLDILDEMGILDLYMAGLASSYSTEDMDLEEVMEAALDEISAMMGEEGIMTFYVQDGLLQSITYQFDIYEEEVYAELNDSSADAEDSSELTGSELMAEGDDIAAPEEAEGVGTSAEETEAASGTEEPVGFMIFSYILDDPAHPDDAFTLQFYAEGYDTGNVGTIRIRKQTEQTDTVTEATISVTVEEDDEVMYDADVYRISFDSATGELDMTAGVTDPDSGEIAGLKMTSVFHDVVPGSSFGWTLEELSIVSEDESIGLTGELSVQADPGTIEASDTAMIFEADEDEINNIIMEIYMNAMTWAEEVQSAWYEALGIEPETEDDYYDYYGYDDDDYWYGDDSDDDYWYGDDSDDDYWYDYETQTESIVLDGVSA